MKLLKAFDSLHIMQYLYLCLFKRSFFSESYCNCIDIVGLFHWKYRLVQHRHPVQSIIFFKVYKSDTKSIFFKYMHLGFSLLLKPILKRKHSLLCVGEFPSLDFHNYLYIYLKRKTYWNAQSRPQKVHLSFSKTRDDIEMKSAKYCEVTSKIPIFINKTYN